MSPVRVHEVHSVEELAGHRAAWDALALAGPEQLPMLSYAWVATFLEHRLAPGQAWRCLFAYVGDELVGVLPVVRVRDRAPGSRWQAPLDAHTRTGHALVAAGACPAALSAMLRRLRELEPHYLWVRFSGVRAGSPVLSGADPAVASTVTVSAARGSGSVVPTTGTVEEFEAGLGTNFRRNLRKARNRAERDHDVGFGFHTGPDAAADGLLRRFLDLEATGWKGAAGTAISCSPRLVDFYAALTRRLSDRGWLEWHFLELDGVPVAGHLAVRFGRSVGLFKIGYDETYARLGPGNLLFHRTVTRACADPGVDEVNCVTDMAWHDNWPMVKAPYSDMVVTPRWLLASASALVEVRAPAAVVRRAKEVPWLVSAARRAKAARTP